MAREILKGLAVSPGIAIGAIQLVGNAPFFEQRAIEPDQVEAEIEAVRQASSAVCAELEKTVSRIPEDMTEYRDIVSAQMELARDGTLLNGVCGRIKSRKICASWALWETVGELEALFSGFSDPYLRDRAQDIRTIGRSLQDALRRKSARPDSSPDIFAAHDISPTDVIELHGQGVKGCLSVSGAAASHAAILARGLKLPAVTGLADLFQKAAEGDTCIVDGLGGQILLAPTAEEIAHFTHLEANYRAFEKENREHALESASTLDGCKTQILANMDNAAEIPAYLKSGAEGIGLYRTEFSFLGPDLPEEEKLFAEYRGIVRAACNGPVVFRTLDIGADKSMAGYASFWEPNPALGMRGIRFCLNRPDIFRRQLRPLLRAMHGANASLLLPMVTGTDEIARAREVVAQSCEELEKSGHGVPEPVRLGVMIETPAAMMICDAIAAQCDFLSLGTNDLLHYLLAIDRDNSHVAYLNDPLHPAFVRALSHAVDAAHAAGRKISVCGELGGDPYGVVILLGVGVDALSTAPRFVPQIKHLVRRLTLGECRDLAQAAAREEDPRKSRALVREALDKALKDSLLFYNTAITDTIQP